jgi:hypothetical protein
MGAQESMPSFEVISATGDFSSGKIPALRAVITLFRVAGRETSPPGRSEPVAGG